ncbi:hypothetical protein JXL19_04380 [bacterium]|nr:hypothetical protein [bacterium]
MKKAGYYFIFICLFLVVAICFVFYYTLYRPNQVELTRTENKINALKEEIRSNEKTIDAIRKDISGFDLSPVNINYFNRNKGKGEERSALFLKSLNDLSNKLGVRLISITPGPSKQNPDYTKDTFEVLLTSDFQRLIHLLFYLKNTIGLNMDRLNIVKEDNKGISDLTVLLLLNTLEMTEPEEQKAGNLEELRALHIESEPNLSDIKPAKTKDPDNFLASLGVAQDNARDPFAKPEFIAQVQEKLNQIEKDLQASRLLGIIDFDGQRHAIIGNHTVKRGEKIFNMEVLEILPDAVVLGNNNLRFTYQLKENETNLNKKQGEL